MVSLSPMSSSLGFRRDSRLPEFFPQQFNHSSSCSMFSIQYCYFASAVLKLSLHRRTDCAHQISSKEAILRLWAAFVGGHVLTAVFILTAGELQVSPYHVFRLMEMDEGSSAMQA